jgi:O-antigen ligase
MALLKQNPDRWERPSFFERIDYGKLTRVAIVLGVLGLVAGIAVALALPSKYAFLAVLPAALPIVLLGMEFILKQRDFGPLLVLIMAAFIPLKLPTGTESTLVGSLVLTIVLIGLWLLRMLAVERRFWLHPSAVNKPLLGFMAAVVVALVWSNLLVDPFVHWRSFSPVAIASAVVMIMLPGAFLLMANHINSVRMLKVMVVVMLTAGAVGIVQRYDIVPSLPINTGGMFNLWVITLATGLALFASTLSKWVRLLLLVLAGVYVVWGFLLHISWLAGWLPGLAALGVMTFMRSKKLVLVIVLLAVVTIIVNSDYYVGKVLGNESNESGFTRLQAWEFNWRVTGQHLLFGTGPAGYAYYYMTYFPRDAMATHSNYIDILAQTGVVGFSLYLLFFLVLAWRGFKLCRSLKGQGDFVEALANSAFAGTVACILIMGFGDWLIPFAYTQTIAGFDYAVYNWLFMGAIVVLERLAGNGKTAPTTALASPTTAWRQQAGTASHA